MSVLQWGRIPWEFPDHERLGEGLGLLVGQLPLATGPFHVGLESSRNVTYSQGLGFRPVYGVHHALVGGTTQNWEFPIVKMGRKFHTVSMAKSMKGDLAGWKWGVRCRRGCMTPQRQGCSDVVLQGLVIRDPQSGGLCLLQALS